MTTCIDVQLNPVPTPIITGPITIYPDSIGVYTTQYSACYLYSWSVINGTVIDGEGTNTITVKWNQCGPCNPGQIKVCVTDNCVVCKALQEGFEGALFPPQGFTQIITNTANGNWGPLTWHLDGSVHGTHSGTGSCSLEYGDGYGFGHQDEWLIAHNIQVNGDLSFYSYSYPGPDGNGDHYFVKISTDHGVTWNPVFDLANLTYSSAAYFNWNTQYTVDMSAYAGMCVDIAWEGVDGSGTGLFASWTIDDINLGAVVISTKSLTTVSNSKANPLASVWSSGVTTNRTVWTPRNPLVIPTINQNSTACCGCTTLDINILASPAPKIQGYVKYKNDVVTGGFPTALNGVTVYLWNASGNIVGTCVTGPNFNSLGEPGYYAFNSVPNGSYHITASFNGAWGGNNATDALIVQLNCIGSYPLHGLDSIVADVNGSMTTTALDALYIKLRTVGMINTYPAGDWKFSDVPLALTVPVSIDLQGLCVGDVNDSYIPTGLKQASLLAPVDGGIMTIPVNESFNYNIRSNTMSALGAMTLFMSYDPTRFEIEKVVTSLEGMKYVIDHGQVSIAWSDTKSLMMKSDDPIITLQMKAIKAVTEPTQIFSINPGSEFADPNANRYDNYEVRMPNVISTTGGNDFTIYNYPNPFQNSTDIVYTLPEQAKVKLVLTNMFGQVITTLVDAEQSAGSYSVRVDPSTTNLKSGVYLYRIDVSGTSNTYTKTNKMLFNR
jgi:hypothetical protein